MVIDKDTFVMICGLPNSGKTTFSQQFNNVIHLDDIPSVEGQPHMSTVCQLISEVKNDICIEGVFIIAQYRKMLVQSTNKQKKICIWLNTPLEECMRRENRGRTSFVLQNCFDFFEPPTLDEGWDEIIIINNENDIQYIKME